MQGFNKLNQEVLKTSNEYDKILNSYTEHKNLIYTYNLKSTLMNSNYINQECYFSKAVFWKYELLKLFRGNNQTCIV